MHWKSSIFISSTLKCPIGVAKCLPHMQRGAIEFSLSDLDAVF